LSSLDSSVTGAETPDGAAEIVGTAGDGLALAGLFNAGLVFSAL
jgi:hypothetical protein